ncbi:MAG: 30S ribosomal protein S11 [Candidatus Yanofskybacteria bacterium RIFCSPHIGHO2_02_FULL_41_29]|uniref:Small ribosomal subunit protein uS11 n=1 Tax=Candidatus Yanofskybacteria bacterium RIFCSPHIGHO2_01_FULL_41_53 TaxID=1802663 RepID=A0A1F8EIM9_9BACT|nr:MAG: 30S ribosomal protein S11 [Candidatus Yanofskybacteria bacterium RIFCSPHIGHO2_01_FULL_41_53]OGN11785.1 MAG: 30S ribosomal protein S11 [Candidatus Yanofskybacteria bacterium RIFCSPHIGHO2_02_FULL_41_29]OGN18870.1 MAG: 30S ribosomal protein S11 [Candidatus Yanofskybacteria bacterium RIFCSPHIGHO2_12_FULL_41_9]OGN22939.1 MAG: 30S ribosomal protein S11 [Candidatus Yanofskybacteria bacterium RIFCSPLOWO2_01_FULL_41_67]OGN30215.1 MAG: 30S ribosomal protein S11 [Candidatus Yanofskybacteria bacter
MVNGIAYVSVSYNNTIVTITDLRGEAISWSSAGLLGFKGTKKSTPYAANLVAKDCIEKAKKYNLNSLKIVVRGVGPGRESAMRGLAGSGLNILSIMDATPIAHNGVRAKKPRRV